ncbi:MAG: hypothetical protein ACR2GR_04650 [Rhodothermales bacterium]
MKQTLLAFLAVTLISLYSINQRRTLMHTQNNVYAREIETVATDLALSKLAEISALAFDEKDVGVSDLLRTTTDSLTTAGSLGPELGETVADFDDIDDYHGYQSPDVLRRLNEESFRFQVDVQVAYVDVSGAPAGGPTLAKQVTVQVRKDDHSGMPVDVKLRRTLTPASLIMY